eukprot:scaffold1.g5900.t1
MQGGFGGFGQPQQATPGFSFGQALQPFGQPASSPFGEAAQPATASPFGQAAQPATASPFGQAAQPATASPFGQVAQPATASPFGQAAQPATAGPFGQAAQPATAGPFGQAAQPATAGPFGQAAQPATAGPFGQAAQPATAGPFGAAPMGFGAFAAQAQAEQQPSVGFGSPQPLGVLAFGQQPGASWPAAAFSSGQQQQQASPAPVFGFGQQAQQQGVPFGTQQAGAPAIGQVQPQPQQPSTGGFGFGPHHPGVASASFGQPPAAALAAVKFDFGASLRKQQQQQQSAAAKGFVTPAEQRAGKPGASLGRDEGSAEFDLEAAKRAALAAMPTFAGGGGGAAPAPPPARPAKQQQRKQAAGSAAASDVEEDTRRAQRAARFAATTGGGGGGSGPALGFAPASRAPSPQPEPVRWGAEGGDEDESGSVRGGAMVGTCEDMCPAKERERRMGLSDIQARVEGTGSHEQCHIFERVEPNNPNLTSAQLAVKRFARTIDESNNKPSDFRTRGALQRTMQHLRALLDRSDARLGLIHKFLWDRYRSARQDVHIQGFDDEFGVGIYEEIVRFHVLSEHELCEEEASITDMEALISLNEMYVKLSHAGRPQPNEAEFRAYHLLTLMAQHGKFGGSRQAFLSNLQALRPDVRASPAVQWVLELQQAFAFNNFVHFFMLVRTAPYLLACLSHIYFPAIRKRALLALSESLTPSRAPVSMELAWLQPARLRVPIGRGRHAGREPHQGEQGGAGLGMAYHGAFVEPPPPVPRHRSLFISQLAPSKRSVAVTTPAVPCLTPAEAAALQQQRQLAIQQQRAAAERAAAAAAAEARVREQASVAAAAAEAERRRQLQEAEREAELERQRQEEQRLEQQRQAEAALQQQRLLAEQRRQAELQAEQQQQREQEAERQRQAEAHQRWLAEQQRLAAEAEHKRQEEEQRRRSDPANAVMTLRGLRLLRLPAELNWSGSGARSSAAWRQELKRQRRDAKQREAVLRFFFARWSAEVHRRAAECERLKRMAAELKACRVGAVRKDDGAAGAAATSSLYWKLVLLGIPSSGADAEQRQLMQWLRLQLASGRATPAAAGTAYVEEQVVVHAAPFSAASQLSTCVLLPPVGWAARANGSDSSSVLAGVAGLIVAASSTDSLDNMQRFLQRLPPSIPAPVLIVAATAAAEQRWEQLAAGARPMRVIGVELQQGQADSRVTSVSTAAFSQQQLKHGLRWLAGHAPVQPALAVTQLHTVVHDALGELVQAVQGAPAHSLQGVLGAEVYAFAFNQAVSHVDDALSHLGASEAASWQWPPPELAPQPLQQWHSAEVAKLHRSACRLRLDVASLLASSGSPQQLALAAFQGLAPLEAAALPPLVMPAPTVVYLQQQLEAVAATLRHWVAARQAALLALPEAGGAAGSLAGQAQRSSSPSALGLKRKWQRGAARDPATPLHNGAAQLLGQAGYPDGIHSPNHHRPRLLSDLQQQLDAERQRGQLLERHATTGAVLPSAAEPAVDGLHNMSGVLAPVPLLPPPPLEPLLEAAAPGGHDLLQQLRARMAAERAAAERLAAGLEVHGAEAGAGNRLVNGT